MGFFRKQQAAPPVFTPEATPSVSDSDLADASGLMDRWDASLGNNDAVWACLEAIARRGGFPGMERLVVEVTDGADAATLIQRPWRWWENVAARASERGEDVLAGRIFLFTQLFATQMAPHLRPADSMETGMEAPHADTYRRIVAIGAASVRRLRADLVIHRSATGDIDAGQALMLAEQALASF